MSEYYSAVGAYFDDDAADYEAALLANPVAERIRQCFREEVTRVPFQRALEVGCGSGSTSPTSLASTRSDVRGDRRLATHRRAGKQRLAEAELGNASVLWSNSDEVLARFGPDAFDLGYVFFGALNTVEDLDRRRTSSGPCWRRAQHSSSRS